MAASLDQLLGKIADANTNISNRIGTLGTHIDSIVEAAQKILDKIRSGSLRPDQIAQIRDKLEDLRVKTMRNINAKNGRIAEIDRIFKELLAAVSPNGQEEGEEEEEEEEGEEQLSQALQAFSPQTQEQMLSYALPIRQAFQENPIAKQTIQEVYEAFQRGEVDAPRFIHYLRRFVILLNIGAKNLPSQANYTQKGFRALTNILNAKTGYTVSVEPPLPQLSTPADFQQIQVAVQRMLPPKVNIQALLRSQTLAQSDVELYYLLHSILEVREERQGLTNQRQTNQQGAPLLMNQVPPASPLEFASPPLTKESVEAKLLAIPDDSSLPQTITATQIHLKKITDGIDSLKRFLQQNDSPINRGLFAYIDRNYTETFPKSLVGAMVNKHKPILLYILSLANITVQQFITAIQVNIPIFKMSDISARKDILGLVIAEFPEGQTEQFKNVQNTIMAELERAAQRGGYKTRCGCGIPARRTLRGGRRRKGTRKTKAKPKATRKSRR